MHFQTAIRQSLNRIAPKIAITEMAQGLVSQTLETLLRAMSSIPKDIVFVSIPSPDPLKPPTRRVIRERGRRNPTADSIEYFLEKRLPSSNPFYPEFMKLLDMARELAQDVKSADDVDRVVAEYHCDVCASQTITIAKTMVDGPQKAKANYRIATVVMLDHVLYYMIDRLTEMQRYVPGTYQVTETMVCELLSYDTSLNGLMKVCLNTAAIRKLHQGLPVASIDLTQVQV